MKNILHMVSFFAVFLFVVNTSQAGIINAKSTEPHIVDGLFSDNGGEWSDITAHNLEYSHVYFDYDGDFLYIMNDWIVNEDNIAENKDPNGNDAGYNDENNYNQFMFKSELAIWELRVFGSGISLWEWDNDVKTDITNSGFVLSSYGYGQSPNSSVDHSMWEVKLNIAESPGYEINWNNYYNMLVIIRDPHEDSDGLKKLVTDPKAKNGIDIAPKRGGGVETRVVTEPTTLIIMLLALLSLIFTRNRELVEFKVSHFTP